jgi:hypothetical protein
MQHPENKIDAAMQSYANKWMKSLSHPRASTTLGYFFVGLFILFWSSSLTRQFGFDLKKGVGTLIFIGTLLLLSFSAIFVNNIMAKIGLERAVRSALWLSAVIGPYVSLTTYHKWNLPVVSHISGFAVAILTFNLSFQLDKLLEKYLQHKDSSQ